MDTKISKITSKTPVDEMEDILHEAGMVMKSGGLVAFPTETVYGLGANALDADAATKIYEAKGRPSDNPLIVHIANVDDLKILAKDIPETAYMLAEKFWPGPLTMILNKTDLVPYETTGGLSTVAIRMPNNKVALQLIKEAGGFVAAPSANSSGKPSPTKASHVINDLMGKIDEIVDAGPCTLGLESTIIDLSVESPVILRPGFITQKDIEDVIGPIAMPQKNKVLSDDEAPKAPGMKYRHYAPKAELSIFAGRPQVVADRINLLAKECIDNKKNVGIICSKETEELYKQGNIKTIGSLFDDDEIAARLYDLLRDFDAEGVDYIFSESFYTKKLGEAIMNRLNKAAGGKIFICQGNIEYTKFERVVFIEDFDIHIAAMAKYIFKNFSFSKDIEVESRGLRVSFEEPIMPKVDVILARNALDAKEHHSSELKQEDFDDKSLMICFDPKVKADIISKFSNTDNLYTLSEVLDEDAKITDPFGKSLDEYSQCFEELKIYLKHLADLME